MELKYFKHLIVFLIATIVIFVIFLVLHVGAVIMFIGLLVLFFFATFSYIISLKDVSKELGRTFVLNLKKGIPIIIFLAISLPLAITMQILQVDSIIQAVGLIALLAFVSIIYYWGIKIEISQV